LYYIVCILQQTHRNQGAHSSRDLTYTSNDSVSNSADNKPSQEADVDGTRFCRVCNIQVSIYIIIKVYNAQDVPCFYSILYHTYNTFQYLLYQS